jgi:hypothetical protein
MRREAETILSATAGERPALIRRARKSLERHILAGLSAAEIDAFIGRLEAVHG